MMNARYTDSCLLPYLLHSLSLLLSLKSLDQNAIVFTDLET